MTRKIGKVDTSDLEREMVVSTFGPPSSRERARWERAKRKRGRPQVGAGATAVSVSVEKGLLKKADRLAAKLEITRAALIARGIQAVLAAQGEK